MHRESMKSSEINNLAESILDILVKESDKFVRKNRVNTYVLSALQIASINFLGSVVIANARTISDKSHQLDFIEDVKEDVNNVFEQIKINIKSVDLH